VNIRGGIVGSGGDELVDSGKDGTAKSRKDGAVDSGKEVIVDSGGDEGDGDLLKKLRLWHSIEKDSEIVHLSPWPDLPYNVQLPPGPVLSPTRNCTTWFGVELVVYWFQRILRWQNQALWR
jgi:hypothetical protein